jgi:propanediol dehydratase small subunit
MYKEDIMIQDKVRTFTGRSLPELSIEKILAGELTAEDFRTSAETLREQANVAESGGYRQLGENLRRAAELTFISNEEVLEIYNQLRPGRSNYKSLSALAERLEKEYKATLTAAMVREAAEVYRKRGIVDLG